MSGICPWCKDSPSRPVAARWALSFALPWPNPQHLGGGAGCLANSGQSRFAYKELRDNWELWAAALAHDLGVPRATTVRRMTLWRLWGHRQRALDPDNLVAGGKPVVDSCVKAGLILGDRRDQASIHYDQRKADGPEPGVLVIVEEFA